MKLPTTRFGDIDIDESQVIVMKEGMAGFEHLKRYIILAQDKKTPLSWFQSIEDGATAFVVVDPYIIKPDYQPSIDEDEMRFLEIENREEIALMAIVSIRSNPLAVSANLRAPIVINSKKRLAKQIVLENLDYPIRYYMTDNQSVAGDDREGYKMKESAAR